MELVEAEAESTKQNRLMIEMYNAALSHIVRAAVEGNPEACHRIAKIVAPNSPKTEPPYTKQYSDNLRAGYWWARHLDSTSTGNSGKNGSTGTRTQNQRIKSPMLYH